MIKETIVISDQYINYSSLQIDSLASAFSHAKEIEQNERHSNPTVSDLQIRHQKVMEWFPSEETFACLTSCPGPRAYNGDPTGAGGGEEESLFQGKKKIWSDLGAVAKNVSNEFSLLVKISNQSIFIHL